MMEKTSRTIFFSVLDGWRHFSSKITGDASRILLQALNNSRCNFASQDCMNQKPMYSMP